MAAYSDFPPPAEFANFMHNTQMLKYLELYATQFDMLKYIKFNHRIVNIERAKSYNEDGKWIVTYTDDQGQKQQEEFDGVLVATGHHAKPYYPEKWHGQDSFKGKIIHSHDYKSCQGYDDKVVVVVGIGNSGGDVAVELAKICKQVILSTGYSFDFSLLEGGTLVPVKDNEVSLYKYVFPPDLSDHNSLGIIGLIQPLGSIMTAAEMQARLFFDAFVGNTKLPSKSEMLAEVKAKKDYLTNRYVHSRRHTIQVDFKYLGELALLMGAYPHLKDYIFSDPVLTYHLLFGPGTAYKYRLNGPYPWHGARDAILTTQYRVDKGFNPIKKEYEFSKEKKDAMDGLLNEKLLRPLTFIMIIIVFTYPVSFGAHLVATYLDAQTSAIVNNYSSVLTNIGIAINYFVYYAFCKDYRLEFQKQLAFLPWFKKLKRTTPVPKKNQKFKQSAIQVKTISHMNINI
uniref:Flavin-containing monooxygenase n=1 Tax=Acrobeloides nanus TaxID=290746 RepID=A0A914D3N6_9BILA